MAVYGGGSSALGLVSCRYGGAVGVTFPEFGADNRGDRSSMPSEAMSAAVTPAFAAVGSDSKTTTAPSGSLGLFFGKRPVTREKCSSGFGEGSLLEAGLKT